MTQDRAPVALPDEAAGPEDERGGLTRLGVFKLIGAGAAGAAGLDLLTSNTAFAATKAAGKSNATDVAILQYALTLEYLGSSFYAAALKTGKLKGDAKTLATQFHQHELAHVAFVKATITKLGGTPHAEQTIDFKNSFKSETTFLKTSAGIEDTCVMTLNGAAPLVTKPVLIGASELVSVEARQASWALALLKLVAAPTPFTVPFTAAESQKVIKRSGFVKGSLT